jgi:formylglycine-generating enzyme required for sulfatase activity
MPRLSSSLLLSLAIATSAPAVTIDWTDVGDPGNACDDAPEQGCFGDVGYAYRISKHEVTSAEYAEFLNAKAASDPLGLYSPDMATASGITRSGSAGSYSYSVVPGRENKPISVVTYFDALRFANWLHNGQGAGDTETGAYTLHGGTPIPSNLLVERNPGATIFVPTEDEWYKAAYYDTALQRYFHYPTGTDTVIACSAPTAAANAANCNLAAGDYTDVGSYPGSPGPNGTFDQGGNVAEWNDAIVFMEMRPTRGGHVANTADRLRKAIEEYDDPWVENGFVGFRVAPEPGGDALLIVGTLALLGLAGWRRSRRLRDPGASPQVSPGLI